jgi:hypothetical protein
VTEAYRQKLLNWLTSMLMLLLISIIPLEYFWFFELPRITYFYIDDIRAILEPSLTWYVVIFVPLFFWHLGDFTRNSGFSSAFARLVSGYKLLAALLVALGLFVVLQTSTFLNDFGCPEVDLPEGVYQFDGCGSWTPEWKMWLSSITWLAICLLALWKVGASLFSIVRNFR